MRRIPLVPQACQFLEGLFTYRMPADVQQACCRSASLLLYLTSVRALLVLPMYRSSQWCIAPPTDVSLLPLMYRSSHWCATRAYAYVAATNSPPSTAARTRPLRTRHPQLRRHQLCRSYHAAPHSSSAKRCLALPRTCYSNRAAPPPHTLL
eukprot:361965-Chlamydomonas_euryale.AAC.1